MKLPKIALQNYQFVLILVFVLVLIGVNSLLTMPRSEDPDLNVPTFSVVVIYPGTSPEDMEELVVNPLEEAIDELDDIDKILTKIEEGLGIIRIEAEFGVDIDEKYDEIQSAVETERADLPDEILSIDVKKFSPLDVLIAQLAIVSESGDYRKMISVGEDLKEELREVDGIRTVKMYGEPEEEIRISLDLGKMAMQNIPLKQVVGILQGNNANIPGGDLVADGQSYNIKTSGAYHDLEEIRNTVIAAGVGRAPAGSIPGTTLPSNGPGVPSIVRLKDIATIEMDFADQNWIARHNGQPAVFLGLTQKKGNNILTISEKVKEKVEAFQKTVSGDVSVEYAFEQAPAVAGRINGFFANLLQGILLVGVVVFIFLGFRPSLVIMTVIPISILMAIGTLDFGEFGIQQISIAGLVIALGLLVDNGIVVIENIMRYRSEGFTLREAAIKGTGEVGIAIVSSTATTLLAFFPLTQLGGGTGEFLKTLPLIVIFALTASLLLALTLTPILSGKVLSKKNRKTWILKRLDTVIERVYAPVLKFSLRRSWLILALAIGGLVGSFALFPAVGVSFFPTADKPLLLIDVETPKGSSVDKTDEAVRYVESVLQKSDFVASYSSNAGHGNPQIYYNRLSQNTRKYYGQVLVGFEAWDPPAFYKELSRLRKEFTNYPGADITFSELKNGPPFEAPIEIKVFGSSLDTLRNLAFEVEALISETEGTLNTNNPLARGKTDLKVDINRQKAGMLGVQLADVDLGVRTAMTGLTVDQVSLDNGEEYDMVVRLPLSDKPAISDLNRIYVPNVAGSQVPLNLISEVRFDRGVNKIDHFKLKRTATITADVYDSDQTAAITENVIAKLEQMSFPEGYDYYVAGEYETQQDSFGDLGVSLGLALLAIFSVLVLQFRSLTQPLIVFSAIPFAFIGSILFLYLTGWSFSFFAFVGFTSLVGIVVNNSIILVDYTNQLMQEGKSKLEAIQEGARTRFVPILLTSLTTILGLLPLTLGQTNLWSPLGWTIIGGMTVSTFLVLLIVPILYKWFTRESRVQTA